MRASAAKAAAAPAAAKKPLEKKAAPAKVTESGRRLSEVGY